MCAVCGGSADKWRHVSVEFNNEEGCTNLPITRSKRWVVCFRVHVRYCDGLENLEAGQFSLFGTNVDRSVAV